uniref:ShKT domain-containing protein n=1 Tax=Parastrongyloides trichosuri TaxID=131310 RepID=A0A0N4Z4B4_PARTI
MNSKSFIISLLLCFSFYEGIYGAASCTYPSSDVTNWLAGTGDYICVDTPTNPVPVACIPLTGTTPLACIPAPVSVNMYCCSDSTDEATIESEVYDAVAADYLSGVTTTTTVASSVTQATTVIVDNASNCADMAQYCTDIAYFDVMSQECAKTCGFTYNVGTDSTCVDRVPGCSSMSGQCSNTQYIGMMSYNCAYTCGRCNVSSSATLIPPTMTKTCESSNDNNCNYLVVVCQGSSC